MKYWLCLGCAGISWACGGVAESAGVGGAVDADHTPQKLSPPEILTLAGGIENLRAADGFLYWANYDNVETRLYGLRRIAERGGVVQTVVEGDTLVPFSVGNGWVYGWEGEGVVRVGVDGGIPESFVVGPYCNVVRHTATALYCAYGQGVSRVDLASREVSTLGKSGGYTAEGLVVDESSVYWTAAAQLLRVVQTGGPTEELAPFGSASGLAGDSAAIYFCNGKQLFRQPKNGGAPVPLTVANTRNFEVFADYVYWAGSLGKGPASVVMATPLRNAGPDVLIATSAQYVNSLAVSDAGVFWSSHADNVEGANGSVVIGQGALYGAYWPE